MRIRAALCVVTLVLVMGCGSKEAAAREAELQSKVDALTQRVKTLEDQQLAADKKSIQHEQVMQTLNQRLRDMETYIGKIQYGQTAAPR